jgi:hypothetical protein
MDNLEKELSPQDSLRLISSMIETTKNSMRDTSSYFLLWGWAVMIACALEYLLNAFTNYPNPAVAWFLMPIAMIFQVYLIIRDRKHEKVKTFINEANATLWTAIGLAFVVLIFVFFRIGWQYCTVFFILLYGIGTFVSGSLIKFRPLVMGGLVCFPLAVATVYLDPGYQMLVLAFAILISYIIPGHLLRIKYRKQQAHV